MWGTRRLHTSLGVDLKASSDGDSSHRWAKRSGDKDMPSGLSTPSAPPIAIVIASKSVGAHA